MSEPENEKIPFEGYDGEWANLVFLTLFELQKKYSRSIKKKQSIHLDEAEKDRNKVSDAYLYIDEHKSFSLDSSLYKDFIEMIDLREDELLSNLLTREKRIEQFSQFVAEKCQPIVYCTHDYFFPFNQVNIEKVKEELMDLTPQHSSEDHVNIYKEYDFSKLETEDHIGDEVFMTIETKLMDKLVGKKIPKSVLNELLTTIEAELLSKLVSEKKLIVINLGEMLLFKKGTSRRPKGSVVSSLLLSPKKHSRKTEEVDVDG